MKLISTPDAACFHGKQQSSKDAFTIYSKLILFQALFIFVFSLKGFSQPAVPNYPSLTFNSPVLISGADLEVGGTYRFPQVMPGVDAHVTIMGFGGDARLVEIDNTTGAGYYDAFQPYIAAPANDTSYIDWKIVFKVENTSDDTTLAFLAVTGIDVDGDGSSLKEFIQAATPGSFALEPGTFLDFSFDGVRSTAISTVDNAPQIDTAQRRSMFQMNFANINTILYRNGAISTYGAEEIRQTSIYFKSFFNSPILLPTKLVSFNVKPEGSSSIISWAATNEDDLNYYTVQKSFNGNTWKNITKVIPGSVKDGNKYSVTDLEKNNSTVYYRLQQTSFNGLATYSRTIKITAAGINPSSKISLSSAINNKVNVRINATDNDNYHINIYTVAGEKLTESQTKIYSGENQFTLDLPATRAKGIYILSINNKDGRLIYNSKITSI